MEALPWGEILASGGTNAALSFVAYRFYLDMTAAKAETKKVLEEQAKFWREVAMKTGRVDD